MLTAVFAKPLAKMCNDDAALRLLKVGGETFLFSSNKAEMSKLKTVRMVGRCAENIVSSACEVQNTVYSAL